MKLSLAANYDPDLAPELARYPVTEVYGKFASDPFGGGRPSYMGTPLSKRELRGYVACLARHGIAFNYLLNASCLGNREWSRRWHARLARFLGSLLAMGVRRLTVATPYLLQAIKARFPEFFVKVGIYAQVDTPRRARVWASLGADALTLESFSINRDFGRLRAIRSAVTCELQLIANHPCLPNCALQPYHQNGFAHASDGSRRLFVDYCFLHCSRRRLEDPSLLVKAQWIRPEDVAAYEALGYTHFKLLERGMPSEAAIRRVAAYAARRFAGNLAALMLPYGFPQPLRRERFWALRHFLRCGGVCVRELRELHGLLKGHGLLFPRESLPFQVDARKIPADFLDGFRGRDCSRLACEACGYCEAVAREAVRVDPEFREEFLERFARVEEALVSGRAWCA
jgi:collagenase-like PrtC family protease